MTPHARERAPQASIDCIIESPQASHSNGSLPIRTIRAASWLGAGLVLREGLSLLVRLLLVRLLLPEHFGLVGMATVFTGLVATVNELGLTSALIQRRADHLREEHFNAAFWTSLAFAVFVFLAMSFGIAPLASSFYREPALRPILVWLSLPLLVRPLGLVHLAKLTRSLRFKAIALAEALGLAVGATVAVLLALSGFGVWSIVAQAVLAPTIAMPILWVSTRWFPSKSLSKKAFCDLFGFGSYMMGSSLLVYASKNLDYLIVGRLLGATELGLYTLAFTLTDALRAKLMSVLNRVLYPVYSELQADLESIRKYYLHVLRYNALIVFPLMALTATVAAPLVQLAFGTRWTGAIVPLRLLAVGVIVYAWGGTATTVLRGLGHARLVLGLLTLNTVLFLPAVWIGTLTLGIPGAAGAVLAIKVVGRFVQQHYMRKKVDVSEQAVLKALLPPLVGSALASGVVAVILHVWRVEQILHLSAVLAIGGLVYLATVLPLVWSDLAKLIITMRKERRTTGERSNSYHEM